MTEQAVVHDDDRISLREVGAVVWRGKGVVLAVTAVFALASVAYALLATEIYRAEVLLAPAEEQSAPAIGGQLGGLAALAGINVGERDNVEALAVLRSRDFAREFVMENNLLPTFFPDVWDAAGERWVVDDPADAPDVRDGVRYFRERVLDVSEDTRSGLVTVAIEWTDPETAAAWAGELVQRLNARLRQRALEDAQTNVAFLQAEMANADLLTLQQSIGQLLQSEMQKLMLARGSEEFAFRVVDPAVPPKYRARPKRTVIAVVGTLLGGMLGLFVVLVAHAARRDS